MSRLPRFLRDDRTTVYHVVSRTALGGLPMKGDEKDYMLELIRTFSKLFRSDNRKLTRCDNAKLTTPINCSGGGGRPTPGGGAASLSRSFGFPGPPGADSSARCTR
jgi:hypothetical protein